MPKRIGPKQKPSRKPAYLLHKPSGRARVRIDGRDVYLGEYGSAESLEKYEDLCHDWLLKRGVDRYKLTIDDLAILFVAHADVYYQKDGEPTSEPASIRHALRPLVAMFGRDRARDFGPLKLKQVRQRLIADRHCRTGINRMIERIKRMFRWAVENEHVPAEVHQALSAVAGLRAGRSEARESERVQPVPEGIISATLPYLPPVVQAMVQLQLLTGARPGEICSMRPCDITFGTDGVWCYRPCRHKTEHYGKERRIYIGPDGQAVLDRFLTRDPETCCFSPAESEQSRNRERHQKRYSPLTPSHVRRKQKLSRRRAPRERYTKDSYCRSIARACELAFGMQADLRNVARTIAKMKKAGCADWLAAEARLKREAAEWRKGYVWSPNQLRHTRGTAIRERYGIEAARVTLGQADARTTEIYAERDFQAAARIMREMG